MQTSSLILYCKGLLNHNCKILICPVWYLSGKALLLISWKKTTENRRICLIPPLSRGREVNMSSSRLSREPPEKTFCVSAACATLCTPQRKGCDENSCCCTRPQSTKSEETWFYSNVPHSCMRCCWAGVTCCISQLKVSEVSLDCLYSRSLLDCPWTTHLPCNRCSDDLGSLAITWGVLLSGWAASALDSLQAGPTAHQLTLQCQPCSPNLQKPLEEGVPFAMRLLCYFCSVFPSLP